MKELLCISDAAHTKECLQHGIVCDDVNGPCVCHFPEVPECAREVLAMEIGIDEAVVGLRSKRSTVRFQLLEGGDRALQIPSPPTSANGQDVALHATGIGTGIADAAFRRICTGTLVLGFHGVLHA